jgi:hypothetical protein
MNDISTMTSTAVAINQSKRQEQVMMSMIRMNAQTEQAMANILAQNARRIEALSVHSSDGGVNLYI